MFQYHSKMCKKMLEKNKYKAFKVSQGGSLGTSHLVNRQKEDVLESLITYQYKKLGFECPQHPWMY